MPDGDADADHHDGRSFRFRIAIGSIVLGTAVGIVYSNHVLSLKLCAGGLQVLSVLPPELPKIYVENVQLTRTPDGKVGLAAISTSPHCTCWRWKPTATYVYMYWMLRKTIQLDAAVMPAGPIEISGEQRPTVRILGVHEDGNVVFLWTAHGLFMVRLELESESMQMKKLYGTNEAHGQFYAVCPYANSFSRR
ncbi:hypothetical protein BAE44_0008369 [Dichanthelium oligosanthes]|uniref:F-box protein AT5G49610-like beta-propeller domain-containing protein n=1 Tax=Dichanthelium oligosanthes TaxID=888268 RepID=A0A1E5VZR0_9POAL|nr:hypothetical protein BAE44_0008369 [Dichanthelium oligosanthes]